MALCSYTFLCSPKVFRWSCLIWFPHRVPHRSHVVRAIVFVCFYGSAPPCRFNGPGFSGDVQGSVFLPRCDCPVSCSHLVCPVLFCYGHFTHFIYPPLCLQTLAFSIAYNTIMPSLVLPVTAPRSYLPVIPPGDLGKWFPENQIQPLCFAGCPVGEMIHIALDPPDHTLWLHLNRGLSYLPKVSRMRSVLVWWLSSRLLTEYEHGGEYSRYSP